LSGLDALALARLPQFAFIAVLLLARIGCAMMLLPGFGEAELPMVARAALAVALAALIGPVVAPLMPPAPVDVLHTAAMVLGEAVTGLWFGWLTRLLLLVLPMAGQIIASVIGLANVLQPDPALGAQTSVLSRLLGLAAVPVVFAAGLHALPLEALAGSYRLIAPGTLLPAGDAAASIVAGVSEAFALALRLAAPFILAGTLWHVALAVIGRLVPNLQLFFMASPGQIVGGLALLGLLGTALIGTWREHAVAALAALPGVAAIEGTEPTDPGRP
jgi:flagellar biosynthetic protein FliR